VIPANNTSSSIETTTIRYVDEIDKRI